MNDVVLYEIDKRGVAEVKLNRPEKNNAYNSEMINQLIDVLSFQNYMHYSFQVC